VKESLEAEDISVEWTTGEGHIVHAFVKGKDDLSDSQFKGRSQLFTSELSCGNFSLILSNVSVTDKGEFNCHYHHSSIGDNNLLSIVVTHFSNSVRNRTPSGLNNSEVKFICTSDGGYPEPKVHWAVNKVPVVDSSRVNTALSKDSRGRYSVTSVLTANVTVNESVTCTIENEKLGDNKTWPSVKRQWEKHRGKYKNFSEYQVEAKEKHFICWFKQWYNQQKEVDQVTECRRNSKDQIHKVAQCPK
uniref:Butyrophilin subfamily 3 member A2-like Ig-C domain-containing protein n=1 Tax=Erpetoichthys calabaricus TaxID=27687 RepID=A0A8C4SWZ6_ERPCA